MARIAPGIAYLLGAMVNLQFALLNPLINLLLVLLQSLLLKEEYESTIIKLILGVRRSE